MKSYYLDLTHPINSFIYSFNLFCHLHWMTKYPLFSSEQYLQITTRSSTFPLQAWNWKLKLASQLMPNSYEELRMFLISDDIDQPRSIEYLIQIVDERKVIRSFSSKKNFTKTRFVWFNYSKISSINFANIKFSL